MHKSQKKLAGVSEISAIRSPAQPATDDSTPIASTDTAKRRYMGTLVSRNVIVAGHRTSIRLEPEMWEGLREICRHEKTSVHDICTIVASQKHARSSLTASIRVYIMRYFREAATSEGHIRAGHHAGNMRGMDAMIVAKYGKAVSFLSKTSFA